MPWNPTAEQVAQLPRLTSLAARLRGIGFDESLRQLIAAIGGPGWIDTARLNLRGEQVPAGLRAATLFWLVGDAVSADELRAVLGQDGLEALLATGLAQTEGTSVRAHAMLTPIGDLYAFSDRAPDGSLDRTPPDYVLPVNHAAKLLAGLTVREGSVDLAVDLGTGQGLHAVLAARNAKRVIATDVNPRALAMARATAAINGVHDRVETRRSDLFAGLQDVRGKVGLLVCNAPFVMGLSNGPAALSAGGSGDETFQRLVEETPAMLADATATSPGGWATLLGAWHTPDPAKWELRPRVWVQDRGIDTMLIRFEQHAPGPYYDQWLAGQSGDPGREAWLDQAKRTGIEAVCLGALIMNRRTGSNWTRTQLANIRSLQGSASEQFRGIFAASRRLSELSDQAQLLDWRLRITPFRRFVAPTPGTPGVPQMIHTRGLALPIPMDPRSDAAFNRFDGQRSARAVLAELSSNGIIQGSPESPQAVQTLATLVLMGFLEPVEG
jgi:methylase of polypeptide subunit release factors